MRPIFSAAVGVFTAGALVLSAATPSKETVQASFSAAGVTYAHVTPGGRLALLGTAVHPGPTITRYRFAEVLSDDDGDGTIVFDPRGGVPLRSVWAAVDLATGAVSVAAPDEYELDHRTVDLKVLKHDPDGLVSALDLAELSVDLLLVRPGEGAWLLRAYEGGAKDGDGKPNGRLMLQPGDAEPLRGITTVAPRKLKAGDVLIAHDPFALAVRTLTLTKRGE
jgi:hypothetical protein